MNRKKVIIVILCMLLIILACFGIYKYIVNEENLGNPNYLPNASGDIALSGDIVSSGDISSSGENIQKEDEKFIIGKREAIFTEENYPVIDGSTATIPLSEAFKAEFLGKDIKDVTVKHNKTHSAYENLINGNADLILVTYPSEDEFKLAKDNNVELEIIPVVNEAFVFFTSVDNPIKNLTLEQIQKIYTGEIKNWSELGGNNAEIDAYQRPVNSGSQTGMLSLVMNGLDLMEPPKEDVYSEMGEIVSAVASVENGQNSIGYSYYYYATTMYDIIDSDTAGRIDLLAVNGVEPTNETIKNGSYPIRTNYYIVINKNEPKDGDVRKLVNAMLSERGQSAAEAIGYVGM